MFNFEIRIKPDFSLMPVGELATLKLPLGLKVCVSVCVSVHGSL